MCFVGDHVEVNFVLYVERIFQEEMGLKFKSSTRFLPLRVALLNRECINGHLSAGRFVSFGKVLDAVGVGKLPGQFGYAK